MPEKISIHVEGAPAPFGHYAQAIKFGNAIHISGQLPIDPATRRLPSGAEAQCRQVLKNLTAVMQATGGQLSNVLSIRLYLANLGDYPTWDKVSKEFFYFLPPALTLIGVAALPGQALVCCDAMAELNPGDLKGPKML